MSYFSSEQDKEITNNGGFFCQACIIGKSHTEVSPDPRYCHGCYEVLSEEARIDKSWARAGWKPITSPPHQAVDCKSEGVEPPCMELPTGEQKTKKSTSNENSLTVDKFKPRGRPKTYKKRELPEGLINRLSQEMGSKAIATKLRREQGLNVSYKTIQRVLSGERVC